MKTVIIGGVAAGAKVAAKLRRLLPEAEIDIYTKDTHVSYSACGMPFFIEGVVKDWQDLLVRSPEEFAGKNIFVHLLHEATKILPATKQVEIKDLKSGKTFTVGYDKLVITTGAYPFMPPIRNHELKNIFTLRHLEDGIAIKEKMLKSKRAVIIGGGYIGIELLEAFTKNGVYTTMIENSEHIMSIFDADIMDRVTKYILEHYGDKLQFIEKDFAVEFYGDESGVKKVVTKSGKEVECDFVVVATGVKPCVKLAQETGIKLGVTGAIKVTDKMETSIKDIYAAGDCVEKVQIVTETPAYVPLGSTANKEGRCAALNLAGIEDKFEGVLGSAVTRFYEITMSISGLNEKQARQHGFEPVYVIVTKEDKTGYMPEAKNITLKLIADKKTHRLLGGQGVGAGDADKRINSLTAALLGKMTVEEFFGDDLTYAPPYSPSIDPLLTAAQLLLKELKHLN